MSTVILPVPQTSLEQCITRHESKKGMYNHDADFSPEMAGNAKKMVDVCYTRDLDEGFKGNARARAQFFSYIARGVDINKEKGKAIGLEAIPEASELDIDTLKTEIGMLHWDMQEIQATLFNAPLTFSYQQIWDLSTFLAEHPKIAGGRVVASAFMMVTHSRLGKSSPIAVLDQDLLRVITTLALL